MLLRAMLLSFLCAVMILIGVQAQASCPPRSNIYPCTCYAASHGKFKEILIFCHRLSDTDELVKIFEVLRSIAISKLFLYDSFWDAHALGNEKKQMLPVNWIEQLRVEEYHIIDTKLSSCFACESSARCENNVTKKFIAVNSSSSEGICGICSNLARNANFSWISCFEALEYFQFSHGRLTALQQSLFPLNMDKLQVLNLTYNQIQKVGKDVLSKLPHVVSIDLSHNLIRSLKNVFQMQLPKLKFLDLSWNLIKALGINVFAYVPSISILKLDYNLLVDLKETEWKNPGKNLKIMDFTGNPIHCDCGIRWLNSTFVANMTLRGHCSTPKESKNINLRRKINFFAKKCRTKGSMKMKVDSISSVLHGLHSL